FKQNWLDVFTYCMVFGSFGMGVACLGPTLLDLGCQTATDLREMSWVFFVQLLMTSIGTIVAGYLANKCAVAFLLFLAMVGMPLTMFVIPSCTGLASLVLIVMLMGLCMGCIDCISNLGMINLFKNNVSPFLQAMHFSYGMGAFLSPMVAEPFLLNVDCSPFIDGYLIQNLNSSHNNMTAVTVPPSPDQLLILQRESRLKNAFYIIGAIQVCTLLLFLLLLLLLIIIIMHGCSTRQWLSWLLMLTDCFDIYINFFILMIFIFIIFLLEIPKDEGKSFTSRCFTCGSNQTIILTLLAAGAMFLFDGLQSSYGGYVYSYSVKSVTGLKQSEGAVLNACFWGTFALGRLIAIVLASRFTAAFMLLVNIVGVCVSITLTIILSGNHIGIYLGSCFLGLFLSSASPTVLSLTEQFVNINLT
ncbi:major facilitator superfamily domain-containing protein 4A, partial [Octopus bimaculoides]|uniref:major facilitator superfamily domain-containing protein 4A n=1 Tax=Octopus bimaculoides TaxID=37653 RepID=UPI0022E462FE